MQITEACIFKEGEEQQQDEDDDDLQPLECLHCQVSIRCARNSFPNRLAGSLADFID